MYITVYRQAQKDLNCLTDCVLVRLVMASQKEHSPLYGRRWVLGPVRDVQCHV
jgi:hypothetical protein